MDSLAHWNNFHPVKPLVCALHETSRKKLKTFSYEKTKTTLGVSLFRAKERSFTLDEIDERRAFGEKHVLLLSFLQCQLSPWNSEIDDKSICWAFIIGVDEAYFNFYRCSHVHFITHENCWYWNSLYHWTMIFMSLPRLENSATCCRKDENHCRYHLSRYFQRPRFPPTTFFNVKK